MTYAREKRLLLGWLALVAPLPLPFNDVLEWPYLFAYMAACLLFLRRAARDPGGWLPAWAMNVLAVAYLPYFFFDLMILSRGKLVASVIHLLLFTVLVKLFSMRRERDKWQTAVAVFFLFLTGMGTSVHPSVALYLVLFLVLGLWLFARFAQLHLLAGYTAREGDRRELLGVPLRGFMVAATVATLLVAAPLFPMLPRVKSPFVSMGQQGLGTRGAATGFSDHVSLDTIGNLRLNREVAMRLRYESGVPDGHEMRFKGGAFEHYAGGVWNPRRGLPGWSPLRRGPDGVYALPATGDGARGAAGAVEIFLRPVTGRNMVLPVQALTVEGPLPLLTIDDRGVVLRHGMRGEPMEYRVRLAERAVSQSPPPYGPGISPERERVTLDVSAVTPRVAELAAREAGDGPLAEQAENIERFLMESFSYSLEFLGQSGGDPIEAFLFERREGHCEYFASAMVLMLRSRGIPARLATGFLGAEYNGIEGYWVVRQSNAHAWVEAYLPEAGWTVFDPTPPAGRPAMGSGGFRALVGQAWDYVLFRWDRYVLTYGFVDQVAALSLVRDAWSRMRSWLTGGGADEASGNADAAAGTGPPVSVAAEAGPPLWLVVLGSAAGLVAVALLALLWWRVRRPLTGGAAYSRLRRSAERAGLALTPADAPLGFAERFAARFPRAAGAGKEVMVLYVRESWAGEELAPTERERLAAALREAESALDGTGAEG